MLGTRCIVCILGNCEFLAVAVERCALCNTPLHIDNTPVQIGDTTVQTCLLCSAFYKQKRFGYSREEINERALRNLEAITGKKQEKAK